MPMKIEIIPWVKFNEPNIKSEVEKLAKNSDTEIDFIRSLKEKYNLSLSDGKVVAEKFYKKEV